MPIKVFDQGLVVRMKGLEPPSLAALDPKSSASTNFATSALVSNMSDRESMFNSVALSPVVDLENDKP